MVVPVRDDPAVDRLLGSLAAQKQAPAFEVVIALDGSRREPRVPPVLNARLLRLPPGGPYAARNAAIAAARGEILLFTDSDCVCPQDWIALADRAFHDPSVVALQGGSRLFDRRRVSRWMQEEHDRYAGAFAAGGFRSFCNTRNFAIRAGLARAFPFPQRYPKGGDGVYGRLLEARGIAIRFEPLWNVAHGPPTSRWRLGRNAFDRGRYGALWRRTEGIDLFGDAGNGGRKGPGSWLLRHLPGTALARRAAGGGLLIVAAALACASAVTPEEPARRLFGLFRRACHLSGRLFGEA